MMLNFDMVGSPNYVRGVYDAESAQPETYGLRVYEGSSSIEVQACWHPSAWYAHVSVCPGGVFGAL